MFYSIAEKIKEDEIRQQCQLRKKLNDLEIGGIEVGFLLSESACLGADKLLVVGLISLAEFALLTILNEVGI